jgi:hypothetical protein
VRVLFVPTFTWEHAPDSTLSSDAVGYGLTSGRSLAAHLPAHGMEVREVSWSAASREVWYRQVLGEVHTALSSSSFDAVLMFHMWWPFASDVRRMMDDLSSPA